MSKSLDDIVIKFSKATQNGPVAITNAITRETIRLVAYIKTQKLQGQVLNQRSGKLNRSMAQRVVADGDRVTGYVGSIAGHAPHARPLEEGSVPHKITAKRGLALAFPGMDAEGGATTIIRRSVMHPGNKPYRYLRSSLKENRANIVKAINAAALANTVGKS